MIAETRENETIWRANFPEYFFWAKWEEEEESVFFHQGSGETLLLNPLGAFVLKTVSQEDLSEAAITRLAAQHFDLPMNEELTGAIRTSLRTFEEKGLILSTKS